MGTLSSRGQPLREVAAAARGREAAEGVREEEEVVAAAAEVVVVVAAAAAEVAVAVEEDVDEQLYSPRFPGARAW